MKNLTYEVTDEKLFNSKLADVEISARFTNSDYLDGDVCMELEHGTWKVISGYHGYSDYEAEFGFKIVK